jgi:thiol-disulfide isomerase/thioredoxin
MKKRLSLILVVPIALLVLAPGPGPVNAQSGSEVRKKQLTQDEVRRVQTLFQEAFSLYQEKQHEKSNERFVEILSILPAPSGPPHDQRLANVHYNMALNHYFLGRKRDALDSLAKAIDHGFWNHDFLARDTTMKDLREDKEYQALLERSRRGTAEMAFGLKDLSGKEIRKADHEGKVLVIDIWGTWCPPCRGEIPHLIKLQEKYGKEGLQVIGLTWERRPPDEAVKARVESFAKTAEINYPVALLSEGLLQSISPPVQGFPTTFFIGRDGLVAGHMTGAGGYAKLEAKVRPLLAAKGTGTGAK